MILFGGNYALACVGDKQVLRPGAVAVQVETSEVCIPDFDYDTISWMLRYMYGCLELTPQHLSHARVSASHPPAVQTPPKVVFMQRKGLASSRASTRALMPRSNLAGYMLVY